MDEEIGMGEGDDELLNKIREVLSSEKGRLSNEIVCRQAFCQAYLLVLTIE